jgi:ribosomal protein S18 acetylase RimI-like enzyme
VSDSVIEKVPMPLMAAVEENLHGHVSFVQDRVLDMQVDRREGLIVVDSGLRSDTFNKILGARLTDSDADRRIEEALSHFRDSGRPFAWWVGPCSRPLDLEERLRRHGLVAAEYELGMTIELSKAPDDVDVPSGVTIRRVVRPQEIADFSRVLATLFDPPDLDVIAFFEKASPVLLVEDCPMRLYVAHVDEEPAAVSELFIGGGIAGVHMVGTSVRYRRRGLGLAMTWKALDEARRLGLTIGALLASEEGQGVYERLGFRPCGRFVEYSLG